MATKHHVVPDMSKVEPFDDKFFKRWSAKVLFFLEMLSVSYVLTKEKPTDEGEALKYETDNTTCRGHILHFLSNSLFDIYVKFSSAREIWKALQNKYGSEDVGKRKYVVSEFLKFQMVDNIPINDQIHQFQQLVDNLEQECIKIDETFQAASLLEKLPSSWNKYKKRGKHDDAKFTMDGVIKHIRIEDNNRLEDAEGAENESQANILEHNPKSKRPKLQNAKAHHNRGKPFVQGQKKT